MILAGDIGGTNTRLAAVQMEGKVPRVVLAKTFASREYASLEDIVQTFLAEHRQSVELACFGVPGPVRNRQSRPSNLPWLVDADRLAARFGLDVATLVNDIEATALGISALEPKDFYPLNEGSPDIEGNCAIISAGTGLGEAVLLLDAKFRRPVASEGGHADFAPRNELQMALLRHLLTRFDHVSYERVLSGPGLLNIYEFLRDTGRGDEPAWLADEMQASGRSQVITRAALEGSSELCMTTVDLFVAIYGAEAGNLALKANATAGVFLGGGIAPAVIEKLQGPVFMEAFTAKGRMRSFLEAIPVRVVLNEGVGLLGAALCAAASSECATQRYDSEPDSQR